jgi:hypothetical protein
LNNKKYVPEYLNFGRQETVSDFKSIDQQVNFLRTLFPSIGNADIKLQDRSLSKSLFKNTQWFAIPRWEKVAPSYREAVKIVLDLLQSRVKFHNFCGEQVDIITQSARSVLMWLTISEEQKNCDILVVSAQLGVNHLNRSVLRARAMMDINEGGLGVFAVGIILLSHPEILQRYHDIWIDCAGDQFVSDLGVLKFFYFGFNKGEIGFDFHERESVSDRQGSASFSI